jgi:hypothetical protein
MSAQPATLPAWLQGGWYRSVVTPDCPSPERTGNGTTARLGYAVRWLQRLQLVARVAWTPLAIHPVASGKFRGSDSLQKSARGKGWRPEPERQLTEEESNTKELFSTIRSKVPTYNNYYIPTWVPSRRLPRCSFPIQSIQSPILYFHSSSRLPQGTTPFSEQNTNLASKARHKEKGTSRCCCRIGKLVSAFASYFPLARFIMLLLQCSCTLSYVYTSRCPSKKETKPTTTD